MVEIFPMDLRKRLLDNFDEHTSLQQLITYMATSSATRFLVSNEGFWMVKDDRWRAFRDYLADQQIILNILFYVRRQDHLIQSKYRFGVQRKNITHLPHFGKNNRLLRERGHWFTRTKQLVDLFGREHVFPRVYEAAKALPKGICEDLLSVFDISWSDAMNLPGKVNTSLSPQDLNFMMKINQFEPDIQFKRSLGRQMVQRMSNRPPHPKWSIFAADSYQNIADTYAEENRNFITTYTDLPADFYDFPPYDPSTYVAFTQTQYSVEELSEVLSDVLVTASKEYQEMRLIADQSREQIAQLTQTSAKMHEQLSIIQNNWVVVLGRRSKSLLKRIKAQLQSTIQVNPKLQHPSSEFVGDE